MSSGKFIAIQLLVLSTAFAQAACANEKHVMEIDRPILSADEGLLLGNGDLSVSVYQAADRLIWRFGKGDVWDRRLDSNADPKPVTIKELAHGIQVEGWKTDGCGGDGLAALRGTDNPKRMRECVGLSPSYRDRPYPCPKPVGELALHLPADLPGLEVRQQLTIEDGLLEVACSWATGVKIHVSAFIPPETNVLVVRWKVENWNDRTRMGWRHPLWFSLHRWPDPTIREFVARFAGEHRPPVCWGVDFTKLKPLPPPSAKQDGANWHIEQAFPPDPLFKEGFRCLMAPFAEGLAITPVDMAETGEARLHLLPKSDADAAEGRLAVVVATSSDAGGALAELRRVGAPWKAGSTAIMDRWAEENRKDSEKFWGLSRVRIADPLLENLWYETLHARRCAYRRGKTPPGLFMPSTVLDYSHWHGDYHMNYNFQMPFWGDYAANHLEIGDSFFDGVDYMLPIGRKIACDYFDCRGAFIQLSTYPIQAEDDTFGMAPLGRMAYMTGWVSNHYWWRYLYTLDKKWLRERGYPAIRDFALFYTDFMKKGSDGLYHIFPAITAEDRLTGDPKDCTDRAQVMRHMRYCLQAAIRASEALGVDEELRAAWRDRLVHAAGDDGHPPLALTGVEKLCHDLNPPEFGFGRPFRPQPETHDGNFWPPVQHFIYSEYVGHYPWNLMVFLRSGVPGTGMDRTDPNPPASQFVADRDLPAFREVVRRWRRPNGIVCALPVGNYGRAGAWTETLGIIAPLQEMMLQSWDGAIRIFPAWPKNLDAHFENLRAEGAFLVSAAWSKGRITRLTIHSEAGATCRLYSPWPGEIKATDCEGNEVRVTSDAHGRAEFATQAGETYTLTQKGKP